MMYFVERDMDEKQREQFRYSLETVIIPKPTKIIDSSKTDYIPLPKDKWRAPPGWTPPGWNEEKSYAAAQSFIGFQANPK